MRVLYLMNHAGKAGTERYVELLVTHLREERVTPFFAYNETGLLVEKMEAMGVPCAQISMNSPYDSAAAKELAALCERWEIDVVHTHYLRENYIAMRAKKYLPRLRSVYTNHFVMGNNFVTKCSNRLMQRRQDEMIAVCELGREVLVQNGWRREDIRVIHNGVNQAEWAEREPSTMRAEFDIGEEEFVLFCASRFAHDKGHAYLVRSMKRLQELTQRPFRLVLAGDGELLDSTKALVRELQLESRVIFAGFRKDMKNFFHGSDLYVNASEHEALSFLIIEAMAAGLPVVVTNMAGNGDIVNPQTDCGVLVEYDNPESMAQAILSLMENRELLEHYRSNAARAIEQEFSTEIMCAKTYQTYQDAIGDKK